MTLILELPADVESRLRTEAEQLGLPVSEYALRLLSRQPPETTRGSEVAANRSLPRAPTACELLAMTPEERHRILAAQAEDAAALYEEDLARPVAERELTAFTALDGEPFDDDEPSSAG